MTVHSEVLAIQSATISEAEVKHLHGTLRAGFDAGELRALDARKQALKRLRSAIQEHETALFDGLTADLRKPDFEAYTSEIGFCYQDIDHTLDHLGAWMRPKEVGVPLALQPASATSYHVPKGVVLIIAPWNYPVNLLLAPLVSAIAAGCHVVCKPAEDTPHTSAVLGQIIDKAFPKSQVQTVQGPGADVVPTLMAHARFDHVFYTGSTRIGRVIGRQCGEALIPCTLELGGKSPAIVMADAKLKVAANRLAWGKFFNVGQTCVAPDYLLVERAAYAPLLAHLKEVILERYGKDPQASRDLARIVSDKHAERLAKLVRDAEVLHGGQIDLADRFIGPTLVGPPARDSELMTEEIFGPILPIITFDTWEEAKVIIARNPNPLAAYFFSSNEKSQQRFINELQFGGGCINDTIIHLGIPELPFGGVQESGIGRYHADKGFETFSNQRSIAKNPTLVDPPLRYAPYKNGFLRAVKWLFG